MRRILTRVLLIGLLAPGKQAAGQSPPCPAPDTTAGWAWTSRSWSSESGVQWSNDSLRQVLLRLVERDQAARAEFGARVMDSVYARQLMRLDSTLAAEMAGILDRFGLPTRSMVGPAGSDAAMLIIQHNWPLQERALASARAIPAGEISPEKMGMLEDRVLVHQGRPQRFGTQFNTGPDGVFRFAAVSDTAGLDARRSAAGMPPMRLYVCWLEEAGMRVDRASLPPQTRPEAPMTPFMSLLLPVVVSAVAVFVLSMIVHMTPWHRRDYLRLPDEDGVMKALRPFNIPPNDYAVPHPGTGDYMKSKEYDDKRDGGPVMFVTILPSGPWQIGKIMGLWFLFVVVVSASMACVVGTFLAPGGNTHAVFHHVAVIAFLTYAMGAVPMSIWYNRKWSTTFKSAVDAVLYALATGLIFSLMWPKM